MLAARGPSNNALFACLQAREDLIDRVCKKEMGVYAQIFSSTGETAQLDRMERRCWLASQCSMLCIPFISVTVHSCCQAFSTVRWRTAAKCVVQQIKPGRSGQPDTVPDLELAAFQLQVKCPVS